MFVCEQMVKSVIEYGGAHARQSDLFGHQDAVVQVTKRFFKVCKLYFKLYGPTR